MSPEEGKYLNEVCDRLYESIRGGVLSALRQHSEEQAAECVQGQIRLDTTFLDEQMSKIGATLAAKPTDAEMLGLVGEFDGNKWAEMFVRSNPPTDIDTMRSWFANAIMAGYDHAKKEDRKKLKSMQDCLNIQGSQGNWDANEYMFGMFNGMEHMMAIIEDREPQFRSWPKDNSTRQQCAKKTAEVDGERVVWAQAYAATIGNHWENKSQGVFRVAATEAADEAVKAFRERYK